MVASLTRNYGETPGSALTRDYGETPGSAAISAVANVFKQAAAYLALVGSLYLMALVLWATVGS